MSMTLASLAHYGRSGASVSGLASVGKASGPDQLAKLQENTQPLTHLLAHAHTRTRWALQQRSRRDGWNGKRAYGLHRCLHGALQ